MAKQSKRTTKLKAPRRLAPLHGSAYWPLFKHLSDNHGLTLLDSEMEDICRVVLEMRVPKNWFDSLLTGDRRSLTGQAGKWGCPDIENLLNAIRTGKPSNAEVSHSRREKTL